MGKILVNGAVWCAGHPQVLETVISIAANAEKKG